jgi:transcriptional regulator
VLARKAWTPDEEARMLKLRASGLKWLTIAKTLGRSEGSIIGRLATIKARTESEEE